MRSDASSGLGLGPTRSRRALLRVLAKDCPIHVRTKVFAKDGAASAAGQALDGRAVLDGDRRARLAIVGGHPVVDLPASNLERTGHGRLSAHDLDGHLDGGRTACDEGHIGGESCGLSRQSIANRQKAAIAEQPHTPGSAYRHGSGAAEAGAGLAFLYSAPMGIAEWVRAARKHKGLSLQQLGDALGRKRATVGHWETGTNEPSYTQMLAISELTGYPMPNVMPADPLAAQLASTEGFRAEDTPHLTVEQLGSMAVLPARFWVPLWDDALAPRAPKGTVVMFDTTRAPEVQSAVLVRKGDSWHARVYAQDLDCGWRASATAGPAFLDLHGGMADAKVVGVFAGMMGGFAQLLR